MKILVLQGSPRLDGNTAHHVAAFKEGAEAKGHAVEVAEIGRKNINGCLACEYCHGQGEGKCIRQDDMQELYPKLADAEMVVLASPIYYWGFSGQMMSAITRFYAPGKPAAQKYALFLSSASPNVYDAPISEYKSMLAFFGAEDLGIMTVCGADNSSAETLAKFRAFGGNL